MPVREFNALKGYPKPQSPRLVSPDSRTIHHRIVASRRGKDLYDGSRDYGYGGFVYDGRWKQIAQNMYSEYNLMPNSAVLEIGCDKGFLLHDFKNLYPNLDTKGTELSDYAIENSMPLVKDCIIKCPFTSLPFGDKSFDLVVAIGAVYTLNLPDAILCLREIERVCKGHSFVTLASYKNEKDYWLFKHWTLLGTLLLTADEWTAVMSEAGYTGDYYFSSAQTLNLKAI